MLSPCRSAQWSRERFPLTQVLLQSPSYQRPGQVSTTVCYPSSVTQRIIRPCSTYSSWSESVVHGITSGLNLSLFPSVQCCIELTRGNQTGLFSPQSWFSLVASSSFIHLNRPLQHSNRCSHLGPTFSRRLQLSLSLHIQS